MGFAARTPLRAVVLGVAAGSFVLLMRLSFVGVVAVVAVVCGFDCLRCLVRFVNLCCCVVLCAVLQIFLQVLIALTGNYTFFNLLTASLCVSLFDDAHIRALSTLPSGFIRVVTCGCLYRRVKPRVKTERGCLTTYIRVCVCVRARVRACFVCV